MNYGRVSDQIYDRSVYKTITNFGFHKEEKIDGAGLGADCAIFTTAPGNYIAHAQGQSVGKDAFLATRAAIDACNRLAAYGIDFSKAKVEVGMQINMSKELREAKFRTYLSCLSECLAKMQIPVTNVQVQVVPELQTAIATAYAVAYTQEEILPQGGATAEQDIVMTKWMGLEGTALLAATRKRDLETKFSLRFIEEAEKFYEYLPIVSEAQAAAKSGITAMQVVREGGIFGGLWQLGEQNHVGLVVDLKKIPVKQETIEICEYFDINPYKMLSGGSILMTTDRGAALVDLLQEHQIQAAVIGRTTKNHDRIIRNHGEDRFLEPAREDAIYTVKES